MSKLRVDKIAAPIVKDEFTGSVYFDGSGDYLSLADSEDFNFGPDDFTIEGWFYLVGDGESFLLGQSNSTGANSSGSVAVLVDSSNNLLARVFQSGGSFTELTHSVISKSVWNHFALVRIGSTLFLYLNGVPVQASIGSITLNNSTNQFSIGRLGEYASKYLNGYISNLRICKGHAVYTGNFTVPTRELEVHTKPPKGIVFPAVDNVTVLLACQDAHNPLKDSSGRHTITGAGNLGGVPGQNLVTNGQFSDGLNGWSRVSYPATFEVSGGRLHVVADSNGDGAEQNVSLVVGVTYILKFDYEVNTASIYDGSGIQWSTPYGGSVTGSGTVEYTFTATTVSNDIEFLEGGGSDNADFYIDNVSLVAIYPVNDANPGLLRKTNITSTITETTGSVYFDGTGDYLQVLPSDDLSLTGDFTIEYWTYLTGTENHMRQISSGNYYSGGYNGNWYFGFNATQNNMVFYTYDGQSDSEYVIIPYTPSLNTWYHIAATRVGGIVTIYINGVSVGSGTISKDLIDGAAGGLQIGRLTIYGDHIGYISNLRICKGHAVYTSNFTPPTRELEVHPGPEDDRTVLLCCHDGENIFAEKTGKIIAAYGDRTSSPTPTATDSPIGSTTVTPGLTREVDPTAGPTFQGGAGFVSQNWLTLPKGTTTDRNRIGGRGVFTAGSGTPGSTGSKTIEYVQISSSGNGIDFGDLTEGSQSQGAVSSTTRSVISLGDPVPAVQTNILEFITIATTGDSVDFGDLTTKRGRVSGVANQTRGVYIGGTNELVSPYGGSAVSYTDTMDYITIASLGNAISFGETDVVAAHGNAVCNSTRGVIANNFNGSSATNTMEYITIATKGDAKDFGDLTRTETYLFRGCSGSNSTRGIFGGGYNGGIKNIIDYITISTLGDAKDFGDLTLATRSGSTTSNSIRTMFFGGYNSSSGGRQNIISYVNIMTTGNAQDFGDCREKGNEGSASSNSHGGLS